MGNSFLAEIYGQQLSSWIIRATAFWLRYTGNIFLAEIYGQHLSGWDIRATSFWLRYTGNIFLAEIYGHNCDSQDICTDMLWLKKLVDSKHDTLLNLFRDYFYILCIAFSYAFMLSFDRVNHVPTKCNVFPSSTEK